MVGTTPDADWAEIGRVVDDRLRAFFGDLFGGRKPTQGRAPGQQGDKTEIDKDEPPVDPWR